nr:protein FAR1-RELATED SEQUENCE 5-like [Ipomoea batatas]
MPQLTRSSDRHVCKEANIVSYIHNVDEENQLRRVFWADLTAKKNYECFRDMVSFDATYRTNMYKLVFVPFTGIDNHKKCVIFRAGLISNEDMTSYIWLLDAFKHCMGHTPSCT